MSAFPDLTTALQAYNQHIAGIVRADPQPPIGQIAPSELPLIACYEGPGRAVPMGPTWLKVTRTMYLRCLVLPVVQGRTQTEGYLRTIPVFNAVTAAYAVDLTLGGAVNTVLTTADTGITTLTLAPGANSEQAILYWGFALDVQVEYIVDRSTLTPFATTTPGVTTGVPPVTPGPGDPRLPPPTPTPVLDEAILEWGPTAPPAPTPPAQTVLSGPGFGKNGGPAGTGSTVIDPTDGQQVTILPPP